MRPIIVAVAVMLIVATPVRVCGQVSRDCALASMHSGQLVTVRGVVSSNPHNVMLRTPECADPIVIAFPWERTAGLDDPTIGQRFRQDEVYKQFAKVLNRGGGGKYEVKVTITGRLDISDGSELKQAHPLIDILGRGGFGSPIPFTRYRIVPLWLSDLVWWPKGAMRPPRKEK